MSKDLSGAENEQWSLGGLDRKLQKSIASKAHEMQKVVREAEYFRRITHDEIDMKIRFMERAVKGIGSIVERSQEAEEPDSHGGGYGVSGEGT